MEDAAVVFILLGAMFLLGLAADGIGFVFLACGLSIAAGVSFILTAMVMGVCVALFPKHHQYPFAAIEHIELPNGIATKAAATFTQVSREPWGRGIVADNPS